MKRSTRTSVSLFLAGAVVLIASSIANAQQTPKFEIGTVSAQPILAPDVSLLQDAAARAAEIRVQSNTGMTIPLWGYTVTSPLDNNDYTGFMVGRTPWFDGHRPTVIKAYLVPVSLTFQDTNTTFDPTAPNSCVGYQSVLNLTQNSPVFQNASWATNGQNIGIGQYVDAFQRANFWGYVAGTPYHTTLDVTVLPIESLSIPAANGKTEALTGACGSTGRLDISYWDTYVRNSLIPSLAAQGVGPNTLPIFVFDSVTMSSASGCCIFGYHSAYTPNGVLQTYSVIVFDASKSDRNFPDIAAGSHEIAEWMNNPDVRDGFGNRTRRGGTSHRQPIGVRTI